MNISPVADPSDAFTVIPVVDYEPPAHDVRHAAPQCRQPARMPLHRRGGHAPSRSYTGEASRAPAADPGSAMSPRLRQAAAFADAALRRVLEVIDRRRPAAQLNPLLAPSLVDSVAAVGRSAPGRHRGAAVLRRMRLQPAGHREPDSAAEVSGSYSRGNRMHAIACRVEQVSAAGKTRWMVVALHIG
ncbi:Rv3235 family protein [Mycobacterium sp. 94-17]|uniref:Rv3235 family protein n=1 Tax=Mycobacterium sp. 94-17 TaxID=2986147 RepID=UPI002D1F17B0|nr:Rv3235 family protein [Mycobacterium sp. 94-17]MEB4211632.1 Rv3235 family protein [Mycobacterium sp. 94-17]